MSRIDPPGADDSASRAKVFTVLVPRPAPDDDAPVPVVELLFDYASPFSYLACELAPRALPGATIELCPVYLRGFEAFTKGIPFSPPKLAYLIRDLRRCAEEAEVTVTMPPTFPVNGLHALRGALAARRAGVLDRYHMPMFRAAWRDGRDISKREVVTEIAIELGLTEVAAGLEDAAIKDELRAVTDAAARRGVFGVPTFFVGTDMFWGHDRMHHVARALR
jgi:2-hydroxychromene-2-carboxylate isomerase